MLCDLRGRELFERMDELVVFLKFKTSKVFFFLFFLRDDLDDVDES